MCSYDGNENEDEHEDENLWAMDHVVVAVHIGIGNLGGCVLIDA